MDPLIKLGMHAGAVPKIFDNARKLRSRLTEPEKILWDFLKTKPDGQKWRRQHPFGTFILDFYCHSRRLSLEIDGGYHLAPDIYALDKERTIFIKAMGVTELRFKNDDVVERFEEVKLRIIE